MRRAPKIIVVAGPNGAGKTSFANEYLPPAENQLAFVNADEIARQLAGSGHSGRTLDIAAGRRMLTQIEQLTQANSELMLETTLATLVYARRIPQWHRMGYSVALIYLRLPNVKASIERVRRRVMNGGHAIPEPVIRRRFVKSQEYLESIYKGLVDEWYVWDSLEGDFALSEAWDD